MLSGAIKFKMQVTFVQINFEAVAKHLDSECKSEKQNKIQHKVKDV